MSYVLGTKSQSKLNTCHPVLQEIVRSAIMVTPMDFTVLFGYRGEDLQNDLYDEGRSKLRYPQSKHNRTDADGEPQSWAVDLAPWFASSPHVRWGRPDEFRWLAGFIMGLGDRIARREGFTLRWGGDWDRDGDQGKDDNPFMDLPHIELVEL
jgi:peptidoglycan L-alanyl-D-glutamate endopeptidase CwlK